jgi:hypothetical protein
VLQSAKQDGVRVDVVNIMTMDYGTSVDNNGQMGLDAISAIKATEQQLSNLGMNSKIGVTPMIGVNDIASEVFKLSDAQALENYAQSDPNVARVSMWSVAGDNGNSAGAGRTPRDPRANGHRGQQPCHTRVESASAYRGTWRGNRREAAHARRDFSCGRQRPGVRHRFAGPRNDEPVACRLAFDVDLARHPSHAGVNTDETQDELLHQPRPVVVSLEMSVLMKDDRLERLIVERRNKVGREHDARFDEAHSAGSADLARYAHAGWTRS